ncbi:MAG: hypothetical protein ACFB13_02695 [Kiloniellaceae bacterium]
MTVILPEIHDGELRKIEIPGNATLTLTFETIDKKVKSLTLEGVEDFRCDGILAGNIVSDIQQIDEPTLQDLERVTCRESTLRDSRPPSEKERGYLRSKLEAVRRGDLVFLRMESSYGCVMGTVCRSYRTA